MQPVTPHLHFGAHLELLPLPASVDYEGLSMTEWLASADDLDRLICGGRIRLWVYTHEYSRPVLIEVMEPDDSVVKES